MALNKLGMGIIVTAKDMASKVLHNVGRNFDALSKGVARSMRRQEMARRSTAVGATLTLGGRGLLRGMAGMINAADEFEQRMAGIGKTTGATATQLGQLREAAINAGIATQFTPQQAVEGLQNLAEAGQTVNQSIATLIPVLDLATGSLGQLGVEGAANAVVGTLNTYSLSADQAANVTDRLLKISQLTNFTARDFEAGLAKAAVTGSTFGQSLNDVMITMGLLRNRNVDASSASTDYREAVRRMASDAGAQQAILGSGVAIYDQQTGKMREAVDVMLDFADKTKGMTQAERDRRVVAAFGARGLAAFDAVQKAAFTTTVNGTEVTLRGRAAIAALRREMDNASGTASGYRAALLDTAAGQRQLLRGTLETFAVVMGEPLSRALKPAIKAIVDGLNWILRGFNALPEPIKRLIMGFASVGAALVTIVGGAMLLKGALGLMGFSFSSLLLTLGQLLVIGPAIGLLLGGFGLAAYAAYRAWAKNAGGIATTWEDVVRRVKLAWQGAVAIVRGGGFSKELRSELGKAENQGVVRFLYGFERFLGRMRAFWEGLKRGFEEGVGKLAQSSAMKTLTANLQGLFGTFGSPEAKDAQSTLDAFGAKGASTGRTLAQFGEIALRAINTLIDLGKRFATFLAQISSEDLAKGIDTAITSFNVLWGTLQTIGMALEMIIGLVRVVAGGFNVVGTALGEGAAKFVTWAQGFSEARGANIMRAQGKTAEANKLQTRSLLNEWGGELGMSQTRKAVGDWGRIFSPESTYGIEGTAAGKARVRELQQDRVGALRREEAVVYQDILREPAANVERRAIMEGTLVEIRDEIRRLNTDMRRTTPLRVTVDAAELNSTTRAAAARDADRDLDPIYLAGGG